MATSATLGRSFPTLRYLVAPLAWVVRTRKRRRTAAAGLLATIAAPIVWWSIQLTGLPDVGEPFDVPAFLSARIPDDRNAFVLYRLAADRLRPIDAASPPMDLRFEGYSRWSQERQARWPRALPIIRRWLEENREAMELFRRGTERPDAMPPAIPLYLRSPDLFRALEALVDLSMLEASRLEDGGDPAAAWGWYRAALRCGHHLGLRGTIVERIVAQRRHDVLRERLAAWAADPRTTPGMIRQALDDAIALGVPTPSESFELKAAYLLETAYDDGPYNAGRDRLISRLRSATRGLGEDQIALALIPTLAEAWRWWRREPERSRRLIRLATAHWLAFEELPLERRPPPSMSTYGPFAFYALGPEAPAKAHALSPEALDRWMQSSWDATEKLRAWSRSGVRVRERANHRALLVLLARELHRRDRGSDPPGDEALIGAYLEGLPDGGSGDPAEGKTLDTPNGQGGSR